MILLYHLIFPDSAPKDTWNAGKVLRMADFKRQINWLRRWYTIVSLEEYLEIFVYQTESLRKVVALTFDDGYRSTYDLVSPYLNADRIPAAFFASTSHLEKEDLLWFVYFNALCFEKVYASLEIENRHYPLGTEKACGIAWRTLISLARESANAISFSYRYKERYPLPEHVSERYLGLTEEQIFNIGTAPNLELGGHTHRHPYLDQISGQDQLAEMQTNRQILEAVSSKVVRYFAYTGGIYDLSAIEMVKQAGFEAAFAITPKHLGEEPIFEMPRTDIYSSSLIKLSLKVSGMTGFLSKMGWGSRQA